MKRSTRLILLLVALLVIIAAVFLLLDFRLLRAQMAVDSKHTFNGSAYCLISGSGYASYLANELATHINASLATTLADRGGRP